MRILAIETSSGGGEVAAGDEFDIRAKLTLSVSRKHARDLAPALKGVCEQAGWPLRATELVLTNIGPGSYTGLRVGLMAAKTVCYATNAALVAVDAMSVLFETAPADRLTAYAIVDAQQGNIHVARFSKAEQTAQTETAPAVQLVKAVDWAATLSDGDFVTGPALERFEHLIPQGAIMAEAAQRLPTTTSLWSIGLRRFQQGATVDFWTLEPMYLRPSSAEIKWDARRSVS